jgi:hypothetical protein
MKAANKALPFRGVLYFVEEEIDPPVTVVRIEFEVRIEESTKIMGSQGKQPVIFEVNVNYGIRWDDLSQAVNQRVEDAGFAAAPNADKRDDLSGIEGDLYFTRHSTGIIPVKRVSDKLFPRLHMYLH